MEKPKLPLRKEKVQSSCIWGLVDIFDFRNGRSNQKLLTNRRTVQKYVSDVQHPRKVHTIASYIEKSQGFEGGSALAVQYADTFDENIKNLLKEEFATLKEPTKQKKASKKQLKDSDFSLFSQLQHDHNKPSKPVKADQLDSQQWNDKFLLRPEQSSCSGEISLDKHNSEAMFEEICSQIYQGRICAGDKQEVISPSKYNELDQVNVQRLQITAKAFIDQIYINRKRNYKDGVSSKSRHFSDATENLNLNMDVFLKLLQDPNSLLMKNIENLEFPPRDKEKMKLYLDSEECGSSGTRNNQDPEDAMKIQKRNSNYPLWKKFKERYGCSSKGSTTSQASDKIVILKPGSKNNQKPENVSCHCSSLQAHQSLKSKKQNIKSTYFSFKDIKRKFKQPVRENQQKQHSISMDESLRRLARNKHLLKDVDKGKYSGSGKGKSVLSPVAKRMEKQQKLVDLISSNRSKTASGGGTVCKNFNWSTSSCSKQRQLDIFMEARRHLSERLRNVDMGEIVSRKEAPRTLKMILSSPEHECLTTHTPKRDESASVSTQMKFSPYNNIQMITANTLQNEEGKEMDFPSSLKHAEGVPPCDLRRPDDQLEISEFTQRVSKKLHGDPEVLVNIYSSEDDLERAGSANILMANELPRSFNIFEVPYELNSINDASSRQYTETTKKDEDDEYMESSESIIPGESHPLRPLLGSSRSLNRHELEVVDATKYKEEHASPVSVLEPFSPEDVSSPTSVMSKPDEYSLQPRRIDFDDYSQVVCPDDPKMDMSACMDVEESLYLYVRAVMEASELSFDEMHLKRSSTYDVLYTCIADKMGIYPVEQFTELQLLFDCIHEVLLEKHECYFGCPPWLSFLRQRIRPVPLEKDVVDEVVQEVNFYLLPKRGQPTLDQLMGEDIAKSGSWLDLCLDTEDMLIQIAEDVLQDSIEDTILEVQI